MGEPYNKGHRKGQLTGSYGDFSSMEVNSEGQRYPILIKRGGGENTLTSDRKSLFPQPVYIPSGTLPSKKAAMQPLSE